MKISLWNLFSFGFVLQSSENVIEENCFREFAIFKLHFEIWSVNQNMAFFKNTVIV